MTNKTILITGGAGMIACSTIDQLITLYNDNIKIITLDNADPFNDKQFIKERLLHLKNYKNVSYIDINLLDYEKLGKILETCKPDVIIHLAARVNVAESSLIPKIVLDNNQNIFVNILEQVRLYDNNIPIIYASSSSVYGKNTNNLSSENDSLSPISAYALSKLINEQTAEIYAKCYNMNLIGLRFFTVFGKYPRKDMFIYKVIDSIYNNTPLILYNNGEMHRDFTYCEDVANFITYLTDLGINQQIKNHQIFNIGKGHSSSLKEIVQILENCFNKKANIIYSENSPSYDPLVTLCDNSKLINFVKTPFQFTSIDQGLHEVANWYKKSFN